MTEKEAGMAIVEYIRQSYTAISTEEPEEEQIHPHVDLVGITRQPDGTYSAVLSIAGGRFNLRVVFWIDETHQLLENRVHIERQEEEHA